MNPRPRVLMLCPWPPYPFDGGSKRIHTLCSLLRERFSFGLATFRPERAGRDFLAAAMGLSAEHRFLKPVFDRVFWFERDPSPPARAGSLALPDDIRRHWSPGLAADLPGIARSWGADLVHAEYDLMALYGRSLAGVPKVLTQHDAGTVSLQRSYFREMEGMRKADRLREWRGRVRFQKEAAGWFDRVVVTTRADRRALLGIAGAKRLRVVPTGVDLGHFSPDLGAAAEEETMVFVGHYPHYPNEDAALWFGREVLPLVRRKRPRAVFMVVGSAPTPAILKLAAEVPGVTVTGTVDDVRPYLARAGVFVAPVRLGRGIKGKVLEAMAMAVPVVAFSRAAEGLEVEPGRDLLVADTPSAFAAQVERLLGSPALRARLGAAGRKAACGRYDWRKLSRGLEAVYDELLEGAHRTSPG